MPKRKPYASIHSIDEFLSMNENVEVIIVDNNACNEECLTEMDASLFTNLKVFEVGDYSFAYVNEVKLIGLNRLERVVVGLFSFRKSYSNDPSRHFYVKNCERLRELKIGRYSFIDYSVCEIENVPSLEVIEMNFHCFSHASLELKSDSERMK